MTDRTDLMVIETETETKQGRPSSYNQEIADAICERLANGEPLARICKDDDMPAYSTVRKWEDENPTFSALSARAKRDGTHYLADDSLRIADDDTIDTQRAKLMIDTRLRLIGKWNAKAYGDKTTLVGGDPAAGDKPIQVMDVSGLTPEQLAALASIKVAGE
jgi:hypothetical protein